MSSHFYTNTGKMQNTDILNELLPDFQQFLEDLSTVKLTRDLERRVKTYQQRIKSHIDKGSKLPGNGPPKLPGSHPNAGIQKRPFESDTAFKARQRLISKETNSSSGGSIPVEDDIYEDEDLYLEPAETTPKKPPPIPSTERPVSKISNTSQDDGQVLYYDFESEKGGSTPPLLPPARLIDNEEEQLLYQDVEDDNYDDDFSDSTDFEEVGEGGQVIPTVQMKQKKGKLQLFSDQFADDPQVDMIGELFYHNMSSLSKHFKGLWVKRYCVAKDMHLICHNGPKKKPSLDILLPGHTVMLAARCSGKKNVLVINHPSKGDQTFSCRSKEEAERWIEVLEDYATMGHEIVPNSGYIQSEVKEKESKVKEKEKESKVKEKEKKKQKKKNKKDRFMTSPELSIDDKGVLTGYVNLYGKYFGESKWKRHWISIKESTFNCHLEANGLVLFTFNLQKTTIDLADEKESRENGTLKIISGTEVYVLLEPMNVLDNGKLLKILVAGMTTGSKSEATQKQSGLVSRLMDAFNDKEKEGCTYENLRLGIIDEKPAPKSPLKKRPNSAIGSMAKSPTAASSNMMANNRGSPKIVRKLSTKPGKPDLILAAKLSEERTTMEIKRKELNQKKKDIRLKKFSLRTDAERDAADEELRVTQREWNKINNGLVELEKKIFMAKSGLEKKANEDNQSVGYEGKVSAGTVSNMKSLFQGN